MCKQVWENAICSALSVRAIFWVTFALLPCCCKPVFYANSLYGNVRLPWKVLPLHSCLPERIARYASKRRGERAVKNPRCYTPPPYHIPRAFQGVQRNICGMISWGENVSCVAEFSLCIGDISSSVTDTRVPKMGRLKAWQNLNPLFSGKYKKLLEEYGTKDYSRLLLQESLQDYLSYACGQCGHIQKLQVNFDQRSMSSHMPLQY